MHGIIYKLIFYNELGRLILGIKKAAQMPLCSHIPKPPQGGLGIANLYLTPSSRKRSCR